MDKMVEVGVKPGDRREVSREKVRIYEEKKRREARRMGKRMEKGGHGEKGKDKGEKRYADLSKCRKLPPGGKKGRVYSVMRDRGRKGRRWKKAPGPTNLRSVQLNGKDE